MYIYIYMNRVMVINILIITGTRVRWRARVNVRAHARVGLLGASARVVVMRNCCAMRYVCSVMFIFVMYVNVM